MILERCRPFSHQPGAECLIPGTALSVKAYPALLIVAGRKIPLAVEGPVKGFTLELNLEKDAAFVYGQAKNGYFKLRIEADDSGISIVSERGKLKSLRIDCETNFLPKKPIERLFLGSHKKQEVPCDLKTTLPILFLLGQRTPSAPVPTQGTATLLNKDLEIFSQAAFSSLFTPRLIDTDHQGLIEDERVSGDPAGLLHGAFQWIRSLFFHQNDRRLKILSDASFECGQMNHVAAKGIGEIDFEWSKGIIRRMEIRPTLSGEIVFEWQKGIQSYRVNRKQKRSAKEPLLVEAGKKVVLDRFQK